MGRRARAETAIARGATSFAHAAVDLAGQHVERWSRRTGGAVLVGAGEIGGVLLEALVVAPGRVAARPTIAVDEPHGGPGSGPGRFGRSRHAVTAFELAGRWRPRSAERRGLLRPRRPGRRSISAEALLGATDRGGRPLLVVDLGVPAQRRALRSSAVDGVTLLGMDELREAVARVTEERRAEVDAVLAIVAEELDRYRADVRGRGAAPVIAALRDRLESLRAAELRAPAAQPR